MEIKKSITTISEQARKLLDISRDEYALCQYLHYRQGYPNEKMQGWCVDRKDEIAEFVGVSRPGLYKMIDRLEVKGLIDAMPTTGFIRASKTFIDTENDCKLYLHEKSDSVNKVYSECKQSLQEGVNKVTDNIGIVRNKNEREGINNDASQSAAGDSSSPSKEAYETHPPQVAPPPPAKKERDWNEVLNLLSTEHRSFAENVKTEWLSWMIYKNREKKGWYKTAQSEAIGIKRFFDVCDGKYENAKSVIDYCIGQNWSGLYKPSEKKTPQNKAATNQNPVWAPAGAKFY